MLLSEENWTSSSPTPLNSLSSCQNRKCSWREECSPGSKQVSAVRLQPLAEQWCTEVVGAVVYWGRRRIPKSFRRGERMFPPAFVLHPLPASWCHSHHQCGSVFPSGNLDDWKFWRWSEMGFYFLGCFSLDVWWTLVQGLPVLFCFSILELYLRKRRSGIMSKEQKDLKDFTSLFSKYIKVESGTSTRVAFWRASEWYIN